MDEPSIFRDPEPASHLEGSVQTPRHVDTVRESEHARERGQVGARVAHVAVLLRAETTHELDQAARPREHHRTVTGWTALVARACCLDRMMGVPGSTATGRNRQAPRFHSPRTPRMRPDVIQKRMHCPAVESVR